MEKTTSVVENTKTRRDAFELLNEYTKNPNLLKHGLVVEGCMRFYARKFSEDEELWGMVGLLHDFDYEKYPSLDDHPYRGQEILEKEGFPEVLRRGIMAHAPHTGTSRDSLMEKSIFAVDELGGFIVAVALVRPSKKLADVKVTSIKKKLKQKAFAAAVSRGDIVTGAEELGISLDDHIQNVLTAMQEMAGDLGL